MYVYAPKILLEVLPIVKSKDKVIMRAHFMMQDVMLEVLIERGPDVDIGQNDIYSSCNSSRSSIRHHTRDPKLNGLQ